MPLTEAQVAKARTFPGCGDLTADNAVDRLFAAAESIQNVASSAAADVTRLSADNTRLTGELTAAQAKVPQQIPIEYLKQSAGGARAHLQTAIDKQAFSPAVGNLLASALIGEGDNLNAAALAVGTGGESLASTVFKALASNGAMPLVGKEPTGQAAPKATPGAPAEKKPMTPQRRKELLAMSGSYAGAGDATPEE
jgi:hypothetical protein